MAMPCCTTTDRRTIEASLAEPDLENNRAQPPAETPRSWPVVQPEIPRVGRWCGISAFLLVLILSVPQYLFLVFGPALVFALSYLVYVPISCLVFLVIAPLYSYTIWYLPEGDAYLRLLMIVYKYLFYSTPRPTAKASMQVDRLRPKRKLITVDVAYALAISVPPYKEEDFIYDDKQAPSTFDLMADLFERSLTYLPVFHGSNRFRPGESPVEFVMKRLGDVYPPIHQEWTDKTSDDALARLCVAGLGAMRLERTPSGGYVVRTNQLSGLSVRPGLARYGGDCFLDANFRVTRIEKRGGVHGEEDGTTVVVHPGEADWEYVKFVFRSSLFSLVTLVDHLYGLHLLVANAGVCVTRQELSTSHPLRRFLAPFLFNTVSVNDNAKNNLIQQGTMAPRSFALTDHAMAVAYAVAPDLVRIDGISQSMFEPDYDKFYKNRLAPRGLATPFAKSKLSFWHAMRRFVQGYLKAYYPRPADAHGDAELRAWVVAMVNEINKGVNHTNEDICEEYRTAPAERFFEQVVALVTRLCMEVTAGHEDVGAVGVYAQDPSFVSFSWPKGEMCGTKELALHQAGLLAFTSTPMPRLLVEVGSDEDWSFLFPRTSEAANTAAVAAFKKFQAELVELSKQSDASVSGWKNEFASGVRKAPDWPIWTHNPKYLETSISV